jgi:endoglucanase
MSNLYKLQIALLTAMQLLSVDYVKAQVADSKRLLTAREMIGTDQHPKTSVLNYIDGSSVVDFDTSMDEVPHDNSTPLTGSKKQGRVVSRAESINSYDVRPIRTVSKHYSTAHSAPARPASLLLKGTMRGFTLAQRRTPPRNKDDYAALAEYGANLARIGVMLDVNDVLTEFSISPEERHHMETTVAMAEEFGFKVVITITAGPFTADNQVIWGNTALQSSLATLWAGIATQFKGNSAIAGYELINEPREPRHRSGQPFNPPGMDEWRPLSIMLITAIRKADPDSTIIWMPSPGGPDQFWSGFKNPVSPLPYKNIVYSFHFYTPHATTHQGIGAYPFNQPYPAGSRKNKAFLVDRLQYAKEFGETHSVPIFVGEFGFNRNSPPGSREQWFEDCIDLFETYGWNWAAHAFRNWEGWDAEIGPEVPAHAAGPRRPDAPVISILRKKFLLNP